VERRPSLYRALHPNLPFLTAFHDRDADDTTGVDFVDWRIDQSTGDWHPEYGPNPIPMWLPDQSLSVVRTHMEAKAREFADVGTQVHPLTCTQDGRGGIPTCVVLKLYNKVRDVHTLTDANVVAVFEPLADYPAFTVICFCFVYRSAPFYPIGHPRLCHDPRNYGAVSLSRRCA
jgi:hypothetical protein